MRTVNTQVASPESIIIHLHLNVDWKRVRPFGEILIMKIPIKRNLLMSIAFLNHAHFPVLPAAASYPQCHLLIIFAVAGTMRIWSGCYRRWKGHSIQGGKGWIYLIEVTKSRRSGGDYLWKWKWERDLMTKDANCLQKWWEICSVDLWVLGFVIVFVCAFNYQLILPGKMSALHFNCAIKPALVESNHRLKTS